MGFGKPLGWFVEKSEKQQTNNHEHLRIPTNNPINTRPTNLNRYNSR